MAKKNEFFLFRWFKRAFMGSDQEIKDIMPPVFRGEHVDLYEVLIIRLLATIVMSAYYKEGTNYASKRLSYLENIRESGCYTDIVSTYLDKFHERFDLFSSEHPFATSTTFLSDLTHLIVQLPPPSMEGVAP